MEAHSVTLDPARRDEAIEAGWLAHADRFPEHEAAYRRLCAGWGVVAVVAQGEVIGALLVDGEDIHVGIIPAWRGKWASRRLIRQMLEYGKTTTMMQDEAHDFVQRIKRIDSRFDWKVKS